jgi:hypothetical protein
MILILTLGISLFGWLLAFSFVKVARIRKPLEWT